MKYLTLLLIVAIALCLSFDANAQKMNNKKLGKILTDLSDSIRGQEGYWQMSFEGITILIITDETHNRMRMITPIAEVEEIKEEQYVEMLEANFHTALDVKYAISEGFIWTTFIHPLKELSEYQVRDGIKQVYLGTITFGSTYSSTDLYFPGNE